MEDGTGAKNQELFEPEMISEKRLFLAFFDERMWCDIWTKPI